MTADRIPTPEYDYRMHKWVPQCPYGDVCSGCDVRGYCTMKERDADEGRHAPSLLPDPDIELTSENPKKLVARRGRRHG